MYVPPYIEGLKDLELVAFGFGILLLVGVIILLTKTKKHTGLKSKFKHKKLEI